MSKDVILINKMCTGSFTISNIGHEIINYFKDDNGDNYIYILPYGGMSNIYDDRIDTIILTSSLKDKRVEVQAIIEIDEHGQIHKGGDRGSEEIHNKQLELLKNVTYGGATLEQIFRYNKGNDKAIYVTFKAKEILKPKDDIKIYISNNSDDSDFEQNIIKVDKNLPSSSLKGYFIKNEKLKITNSSEEIVLHDFDRIKEFINKNKEKLFEVMNTPKINKKKVNDFNLEKVNINYLQLIEKEDEEQIYTNLLSYWLNCNNLIDIFINEKLFISDRFEVKKEKRVKHGRMDIFAISEKRAIIIENKILSGLNGVDKVEETTQLGKYVKDIEREYEIKQNEIYGMIFVPDYNIEFLNKEIKDLEQQEILKYYKIIPYSELYEFFNKKEIRKILKDDLYYNFYYDDFLRCIKNHTFNSINEKNKNEMERKFIYAIKKALNN